jgi:hypothetical protein
VGSSILIKSYYRSSGGSKRDERIIEEVIMTRNSHEWDIGLKKNGEGIIV